MTRTPTTTPARVPLDEGHVVADFRLAARVHRARSERVEDRLAALAGRATEPHGAWTTWRAVDLLLGRQVALKLLPRERADVDACRALAAELRQGVWVAHPGLARRYGLREDDEWIAVAEAWIDDARTLADVAAAFDDAARRQRRLVTLVAKVAEALSVAHGVGLVHGALSPGNVLVTVDGLAKLSDVGLLRLVTPAERVARLAASVHASPEQCLAVRHGHEQRAAASDQFALAALLQETLTGRHPFAPGDDPRGADALVRPRARLASDPALDVVLARALEVDPRDRYPDAAAFADDLLAVVEGRRPSARRPGLVGRARRTAARWARRVVG